jgi:UDP-N-acetylglucosamine 4,6-dehydratase/5-epimerase
MLNTKYPEDLLDNKRILITGGTGSFGNELVTTLLNKTDFREIVIFSRDEKKQHDMRNKFHSDRLKFIIGNVRDQNAVNRVMKKIDYVFHAAALKQVPSCEFFPMEAVKTNIIGTANVLDAAEDANVSKVVVLSTDKAVYPINAMGMTKALLEKVMTAKARSNQNNTTYCGVRYGNVMYSRGSVLPLFLNQIKNGQELTVTDPTMTRFLLPLPVAIDLVLHALQNGSNGDLYIRKSPASTIEHLAQSMIEIFEYENKIRIIGVREGEKKHETLVSSEEFLRADDYEDYFCIKNLDKIDYSKFFSDGVTSELSLNGYTSENTQRLSLKETRDLILSLKEIQNVIK